MPAEEYIRWIKCIDTRCLRCGPVYKCRRCWDGGLLIGKDGVLITCPCSVDPEKELARRLTYADLPHAQNPKTFENFEVRAGTQEGLSVALAYAKGEFNSHLLTLHGRNGSGKSHLLEAIGRHMVAEGMSVKYALAPSLLDALRDSYDEEAEDSYRTVYDRYANAPVLLLDDLGLGKSSEWAIEKLTMLVDDRYRNSKPMVVATNLSADQMVAEGWGYRMADRIWDTESGTVRVVSMTAASYRTGKQWQLGKTAKAVRHGK